MTAIQPNVAILAGPTATGKTSIAVEFARKHGGIEIISADSLLVYRDFNIGTAKPTDEERGGIPHHLIDVQDPNIPYTAGDFITATEGAIADIHSRGRRALLVGGTGFYLKALLYGMWDAPKADPKLRAELEALPTETIFAELQTANLESSTRIGPRDRYRLIRALEIFKMTGRKATDLESERPTAPREGLSLFAIDRPTHELDRRITARTGAMLESGWLEETKALLAKYPEARALRSVGYAQIVDHFNGVAPEGRKLRPGIPGLTDEIELTTRQLVKNQRTWFRGEKATQHFELDRDLEKLRAELNRIYSGAAPK